MYTATVEQKPSHRYREEAARIRRYAEGVIDQMARQQLANIAFQYDRLADTVDLLAERLNEAAG